MKIDPERIRELAALDAVGALDGAEAQALIELLRHNPNARRQVASYRNIVEALVRSLPPGPQPSAGLREKIMLAVNGSKTRAGLELRLKQLAPPSPGGLGFLRNASTSGWLPLCVPGAFVKLLSYDEHNDYATVLGKLEPGARYPAHQHVHAEDIYMLEGDLHVGEEVMGAGDFHHAEAATRHGVNWSEHGCVLLAVLSKEDLLRQFAAV